MNREPLLRPEGVREGALRFGIDPDELILVNAGVNEVYRGPGVFVRFGSDHFFDGPKQLGATSFLAHVHAAGAPVCEPLRSAGGSFIESLEQDGRTWQVTTTREAPGILVDPRRLTVDQARAWGRAIACLHEAAGTYTPPEGALIKDFTRMWTNGIREVLDRNDPELVPHYDALSAWREAVPRIESAFGVTHGDMRGGNVLWDGARVVIIDFDEPNWHHFAADLARPLLEASRHERASLLPALVDGYREVRVLPERHALDLPAFMRERALIMYAWSLEEGDHAALPGELPDPALTLSGGPNFLRWLRRIVVEGED